MPDDFAFNIHAPSRPLAFANSAALPLPANNTPSVRELLSRNGALALQNLQLAQALARLTTQPPPAMAHLTPRQQQVMALVLQGHPNKNIAADLNISQRTVENHRAAIMRRTGAASLPALVRLSLGIA